MTDWRVMRAGGTLFATVVGVGVFGLPYVFWQAGFVVGLTELVALGFFELLLLLMYAEITIQTPGKRRLGGYIGYYLGPWGGRVSACALMFSMTGGLLAFTILGGDFFFRLTGFPPFVGALCVAVIGGLFTSRGLAVVSRVAVWAAALVVGLYLVLIVATLPAFHAGLLVALPPSPKDILWPYGVILFALAGLAAIPEMHDILGRQARLLSRVTIASYAAIVVLYALFSFAVAGASGSLTTPDTIGGLTGLVHPAILLLGTVLGFISVISIYTMVSMELIDGLMIDVRLSRKVAWSLAAIAPIVLYVLGVREFISVLGFVGSVLAGFIGVFVVLTYEKMKKTTGGMPSWVSYLTLAVFLFGVISGIVYHII